jgi:glycosyltransferase involved in cell wall biosynthesis
MSIHPRISIALATYNGERYLKEQLESYVKQTLLPYELVACDDASSDSTVAIVEEFSKTAPFPVRVFRNEKNLGFINNFSLAASLCHGDYIAFSDQDDIWLPDKLEVCCRRMKMAEEMYGPDIPLLVHSDLCLIDEENHVIAPSHMRVKRWKHNAVDPLRTLLVQNYVSGCTMLCNRPLIKKSLPFPDVLMNHDGWVSMIAASTGKIFFIPEATLLYRQHENNVTGRVSPLFILNIKGVIQTILKAARRIQLNTDWIARIVVQLHQQAHVLKQRLIDLSCDVPPYLNSYIDTLQTGGVLKTLNLMVFLKVRQPGFSPNLILFYIIARRLHVKLLKDQCQ